MASLDVKKYTLKEAKGLCKHNGQKERETLNHSNPDIDKSLTALNYTIGCTDYSEAVLKLEERTKAVDEVQPPKRNNGDKRIVAVSVYAPCPQSIKDSGRADEFHRAVYDFLCDYWGAENVHGMCVHKDEVHEYTDKHGVKRESLEHSQTLVSPYTETHGINGKEFLSYERHVLRDLQAAMNEMVRERFGVDYNTGDTPERKTVEQLKREQIKARTEKEISDLTEEKNKAQKLAEKAKAERDVAKAETEDYVRALNPETTTKTTKGIIFKKEIVVEKTEEEQQRDRDVAAAQAVLRDKDDVAKDKARNAQERQQIEDDKLKIAEYLQIREAENKRALAEQQKAFEGEIQQLKAANQTLKERLNQFIAERAQQARAMALAIKLRARLELDKMLDKMGLKVEFNDRLNKGYNRNEEQSRQAEQSLTATGGRDERER